MSKIYKTRHRNKGFTLVELLVVLTMLSIFLLVGLMVLNPYSQFNKAKDSQKKQDLGQIRNALDLYYSDTGCYPTSVPFGSEWKVGNTVYMKKVPQDPDCAVGGYCYVYQVKSGDTCPQWNALYAHLLQKFTIQELKDSCPLFNACGVLFVKLNYCLFSGTLDCTYIKSNPAPGGPSSTPAPTATPTISLTPTPTPFVGVCTCQTAQFDIRAGACNNVGLNNGAKYCNSIGGICVDPCSP